MRVRVRGGHAGCSGMEARRGKRAGVTETGAYAYTALGKVSVAQRLAEHTLYGLYIERRSASADAGQSASPSTAQCAQLTAQQCQ